MAALITVAIAALCALFFDYYYEFNDDVLMKDILSGRYTGKPDGLNIQMLSPLGYALAFFYRVSDRIPWYGLFLCGMQYLSIFIILRSLMSAVGSVLNRVCAGLLAGVFMIAFVMPHLVMVQYTVTVAFMAAAACAHVAAYLFSDGKKAFGRDIYISGALIVAAFLLRSEMLLLLMPFIFYVWLWAVSEGLKAEGREKKTGGDNFRKCICLALSVFVLMGLGIAADTVSYSSEEWRVFRDEFDARTQLYDYRYIPDYDDNRAFYDDLGLGRAQVMLLETYDYGLDAGIDGEVLRTVADYAASKDALPLKTELGYIAREYLRSLVPGVNTTEGLWKLIIAALYTGAAFCIFFHRSEAAFARIKVLVLRLGGLYILRSISWIYIIHGRRTPDRITHPLYMIETVTLACIILSECAKAELRDRSVIPAIITAALTAIISIACIPSVFGGLSQRIERQEEVNTLSRQIEVYAAAHPDSFYWEDVYSTIIDGETFNEKIFAEVENDDAGAKTGVTGTADVRKAKNYDLIGGWAMNSPLLREKLSLFGIEDIAEDLAESDTTFIIVSDIYDTGHISEYYEEQGFSVEILKVDEIGDYYGVYRVDPVQ